MNTQELKNTVIEKIYDIDDDEFLLAIKIILDVKSGEAEIYKLNDQQRKKIKLGKRQAVEGKLTDNEKVFQKTDTWLGEKSNCPGLFFTGVSTF